MSPAARGIIFLDRDGVIVRFPGNGLYVTCADQLQLIPHAARAIQLLTHAGYEMIVISNQGCVSHGLITMAQLEEMTGLMLDEIRREGGQVSGVFYCIHQTSDNCDCKKPKTGLFKKALKGRENSVRPLFFIGDSREDMEAGKRMGCRTILVLSGRTCESEAGDLDPKPDVVKKDLLEAAQWILQKKS